MGLARRREWLMRLGYASAALLTTRDVVVFSNLQPRSGRAILSMFKVIWSALYFYFYRSSCERG